MKRPDSTSGMRHVALFVDKFEACEHFYTELMGMAVEWRPDDDNVYLSSGNDNLALHKVPGSREAGQLDHIGFFINEIDTIITQMFFLLIQQHFLIHENISYATCRSTAYEFSNSCIKRDKNNVGFV